jgi:hypothetical protein
MASMQGLDVVLQFSAALQSDVASITSDNDTTGGITNFRIRLYIGQDRSALEYR